jgi:hypothetical protein
MSIISKQTFIIVAALIMMSLFGCNNTEAPQAQSAIEDEPTPVKKPSLENRLQNQLIKADWDANAAQSVVALNKEWFVMAQQDNPEQFEKQIHLLKELGNYPHLMPVLNAHPERAALLALALAALDNPDRFAQALKDDECDDIISGLFMQHAAPDDAAALAKALEIHRTLICRLAMRGLIGSHALFIFPRDNPGAQEYERWLREILNDALGQSKEKLASVVSLLFEQGSKIRGKMIDDEQFRYAFRSQLWPKFIRVTTQTPYELYLSDPYLWDLLALPQGERLLEKWVWFLSLEQMSNLTPATVLFGKDAYPDVMQPFIIEAILAGDPNTLIPLLYFGRDPLFIKFMQRNLSEDVQKNAFNVLIAQDPNYHSALEDWEKASDADLYYELLTDDPGTLYTLKKVVQGREVSGEEAFWLVLDTADMALTAADLMFTGGTLYSTVVTVGKTVAKQGIKKGAKKVLKKKIVSSRKLVEQSVGKNVAKQASEQMLRPFANKQFFSELQTSFGQRVSKKYITFEITPMLRFSHKQLNVNRKTFLRISQKWDARLFMRPNTKVLVNVNHEKLSTAACLFFKLTATTGLIGRDGELEEVICGIKKSDNASIAIFETVLDSFSEVGKNIFMSGKTSLESTFPKDQEFQKDQEMMWQKNASAWWLMNAFQH